MKNKAFTLIEIIAALVILAVIALIAIPIVTTIIEKSEKKSDRISVENYAHAIELALAQYELENGDYPNTLDNLKINYTGSKVQCNIKRIRSNGEIFLSECYVDGNKVEDKATYDKYYHYGKSDYELVDAYGKELEKQTMAYVAKSGQKPEDVSIFETQYDSDISCNNLINEDNSIYLYNCIVNGINLNYKYGEDKRLATDVFLSKANNKYISNYSDGNKGEMYVFSHLSTTQTGALKDYRYIGDIPNNYIVFNDELWRIIGIFTVEDLNGNQEQRVKIVRNNKLENSMSWNTNNRVNKWESSSLSQYLNGTYYNSLSSDTRKLIDDSLYYLGSKNWVNTLQYNGSADDYYEWERGEYTYTGASRNWIGKIALIYPSDYLYTYALGVDDTCYNNQYNCYESRGGNPERGWIYNSNSGSAQWVLMAATQNNDQPSFAMSIIESGFFTITNVSYGAGCCVYRWVRPSLYLSPDVKIDSGDGSEQNPYRIKL